MDHPSFNILTEPWVKVLVNGQREVRPFLAALQPDVERLDFDREDENLSAYEMLTGIVHATCPPTDPEDWGERRETFLEEVEADLERLMPAFELFGEKAFMQDLEPLEDMKKPAPLDILYLDSSGDNAAKKNTDVMVHRDRVSALSFADAVIALYMFQTTAGFGGAGNLTGMRGGGPAIGIVRPKRTIIGPMADIVWANVAYGKPVTDLTKAFPWMRPTVNDKVVHGPTKGVLPPEVYFSMPRRVRLVIDKGRVVAIRQKPKGIKYGLWRHPNTAYYKNTPKDDPGARHLKPGQFSYRHWPGITMTAAPAQKSLHFQAENIRTWFARTDDEPAQILLGGWAMRKSTALDYVYAEQPIFPEIPELEDLAICKLTAAGFVVAALKRELAKCMVIDMEMVRKLKKPLPAQLARVEEAFWQGTQFEFERGLADLSSSKRTSENIRQEWRKYLSQRVLRTFDEEMMPGLFARDLVGTDTSKRASVKTIADARRRLAWAANSDAVFDALKLVKPKPEEADRGRDKIKSTEVTS